MKGERRKGGRPFLGEKGRVHRVNLRLTAQELAIVDAAVEAGEGPDRAALVRDLALKKLTDDGYQAKKSPAKSAA